MGTKRQDRIAQKTSIKTKLNVSEEGILTVGYGFIYVLDENSMLIPIVCEDEFGSVHPIVKGTTKDDTLRTIDTTPSQGDLGTGTPDAP